MQGEQSLSGVEWEGIAVSLTSFLLMQELSLAHPVRDTLTPWPLAAGRWRWPLAATPLPLTRLAGDPLTPYPLVAGTLPLADPHYGKTPCRGIAPCHW